MLQGVTACDSQGNVSAIELGGLGMSGQIPSNINVLTALSTLNVSHNFLFNSLPPSLGSLPALTVSPVLSC